MAGSGHPEHGPGRRPLRPGISFATRFPENATLNAVQRLSGLTRRVCLNEKMLGPFHRVLSCRHPHVLVIGCFEMILTSALHLLLKLLPAAAHAAVQGNNELAINGEVGFLKRIPLEKLIEDRKLKFEMTSTTNDRGYAAE